MRSLSPAAAAAIAAARVPIIVLIEMDLSTPLNLCTAGHSVTYGGVTYIGVQPIGRIDAVQDSPAEIKPMAFELSGVPSTQVALALGQAVQGRAVRLKTLLLDPSTFQPIEARLRWQGRLDVMSLECGPVTSTIRVTAEHGAIDLLRTTVSYWSDSEQRRLFGGDPSLQYLADQVDQKVVWPAASYERK